MVLADGYKPVTPSNLNFCSLRHRDPPPAALYHASRIRGSAVSWAKGLPTRF